MSSLDWLPADVRQRSTVRSLDAGETLFRQRQKASAIFEVEEGRLRLMRYSIESHPIVLHTATKGELFAEAALFALAYQCDAVAIIPSRVRVYPKRELLITFRNDPAVAERFMAVLAHQIHALRARIEERNIRSARKRVLHHLALAAGKDGRTMRIDGTLMELAAELGLTHEVLYRTLAGLEQDGAIARTGQAITIRNRVDV